MKDKYDVIIGLEVHIQLKTASKMFCSCSAQYFEEEQNTYSCPVCMGMPGTLPVPNKKALEYCILLGLATNCEIADEVKFDRKHYFYPDLPKGYQISQYEKPLCSNGKVTVRYLDEKKNWIESEVEIERIHQEEDVAKSLHMVDAVTGEDYTLIDYNKAGVPLTEIVTKPVIRSPEEARAYAERIRQIARYLGISDADMEKGQMRCEPNVSVQKKGCWEYKEGKILPLNDFELYPKVEVKNIGSISAVEKSLKYEIDRLISEIEDSKEIKQQTRGWNADEGKTEFQRSKESADDYRYFKDPDIPYITVGDEVVDRVSENLVELPTAKENRYKDKYKLSDYDITVLTAEQKTAKVYEEFLDVLEDKMKKYKLPEIAKEAANWFASVIFAYLNECKIEIEKLNINWEELAGVVSEVKDGKINASKARELVSEALVKGASIRKTVREADVEVVADESELQSIVEEVIKEQDKAVSDYKSGKRSVMGFLIGQVMQKTKGNADPNVARKLLIEELES